MLCNYLLSGHSGLEWPRFVRVTVGLQRWLGIRHAQSAARRFSSNASRAHPLQDLRPFPRRPRLCPLLIILSLCAHVWPLCLLSPQSSFHQPCFYILFHYVHHPRYMFFTTFSLPRHRKPWLLFLTTSSPFITSYQCS